MFKVIVLLYIAHFLKKEVKEGLVKFVNLGEKTFFLQNLLPGRAKLKEKFTQPVDRTQRYFSRWPHVNFFLIISIFSSKIFLVRLFNFSLSDDLPLSAKRSAVKCNEELNI